MTVGQRIREKRLEQGLTQTDLAIKMGYRGKTAVCMAETGGDNITTTKVQKFATALGVSPIYLMFGTSDDEADKHTEELKKLSAYLADQIKRLPEKNENYNGEYLKKVLLLESDEQNEIQEFLEFYKAFKSLPKSKQDAIRSLLELPQSDS